jgi:hypothetical protein
MKSGSINFSALHDETESGTGANMQTLFTHWTNSANVALAGVKFTTGTTGDHEFESDGFLTSLEMNAGTEDNVTISGTIELNGAITYAEIPS